MGLEKLKKVPIFSKYQITHHSYCDVVGALKAMPQWFNSMGYYFYEKGLSEKDIGTGHQVESEWTASREVTEYIKFEIDVRFLVRDIKKVVLDTGEEVYWARLLVVIDSALVKNYRNRFGTRWYEEMMRQVYERFVVKEDVKKYLGKIFVESTNLADTIKSYLK